MSDGSASWSGVPFEIRDPTREGREEECEVQSLIYTVVVVV